MVRTNCRATGSTLMMGVRRSLPWSPKRSIALPIFSSDFAPRPGSSRSFCSAKAALRSSSVSTPRRSRNITTVLGPRPGMRVSSTNAGGYLARSCSSCSKVPVASISLILLAVLLPTPSSSTSSASDSSLTGLTASRTAPAARSWARTRKDCGEPSSSFRSSASSARTPAISPLLLAIRTSPRGRCRSPPAARWPRIASACRCARRSLPS